MSTRNLVRNEAIAPSDEDAHIARQSRQALASLIKNDQKVRLHVHAEGASHEEIALPLSVSKLLLEALEEIGKGNEVILVSTDAELSTQQAADMARVSRPFFVKLLEEGKLPYRKVGAHRRVLHADVVCYMEEEEKRRIRIMEELVAETERLGLYE